ncbi:hypothetical protein R50073_08680 [Maricurvus nonylphenolicus]|uniref:hypothetical protein n=1 Tax=Maricurvus nonylphenolicus TaxID=1008307 RepID=UPI0036F37596
MKYLRRTKHSLPIALTLLGMLTFGSSALYGDETAKPVLKFGTALNNEDELIKSARKHVRKRHQAIYDRLGYQVELINNPYLRNIQLAADGSIDTLVVMTSDIGIMNVKELPESLILTQEPQHAMGLNLAALKSRAIEINKLDEAKSLRLGIIRAIPYIDRYLFGSGFNYQQFPDNTTLLHMLKAERLDIILTSSFLLEHISPTSELGLDIEMVYPMGCVYFYIAYSATSLGKEKAQAMANKHTTIIRELKRDQPELFHMQCQQKKAAEAAASPEK